MSSHPVPRASGAVESAWLDDEVRRLAAAVDAAVPVNTRRARANDWAGFTRWCDLTGRTPLPATSETLAHYLVAHSSVDGELRKPATLRRWIASIGAEHVEAGLPRPDDDPGIRKLMRGLTTAHPEKGRPRRVAPLTTERLVKVLQALDHDTFPAAVAACRDAALLLLSMAAATRRSELVDLTWADLQPSATGQLVVLVRHSKTDQLGQGQQKVIKIGARPLTCQVCAIIRWAELAVAAEDAVDSTGWRHAQAERDDARAAVDAARATGHPAVIDRATTAYKDAQQRVRSFGRLRRDAALRVVLTQDWNEHVCEFGLTRTPPGPSPVFRRVDRHGEIGDRRLDAGSFARILKARVAAAGFDPAEFSGHSPRAGHVTTALDNGVPGPSIRRQVGWRTEAMLPVYDRHYLPERGNSVDGLGL